MRIQFRKKEQDIVRNLRSAIQQVSILLLHPNHNLVIRESRLKKCACCTALVAPVTERVESESYSYSRSDV